MIVPNMQNAATQQAIPPHVQAMQLITGIWASQAIYMACKLTLPDALAAGARTARELAEEAQVQARPLYRLLRALATLGVLEEDDRARFALTPIGQSLRSHASGSLCWLAQYMVEAEWEPWRNALHSIRSGESAIVHLFGKPIFEYLQDRSDLQMLFGKAMAGMARQLAAAVSAAYDFSNAKLIVDVGGGRGDLIASLLTSNPQSKGIVFDLPHVVEGMHEAIERPDVRNRCNFVGGNFFERIPPGADLYLMSYIIHDWDDDRAVEILSRCREAMTSVSKLLLIEIVLPPAGVPSFGKLLDLEMLVIAGGQERTEREYCNLLGQAGLQLKQVIPSAAPQSIIEAVVRM